MDLLYISPFIRSGPPFGEATEKVPIWSLDILYIDINTVIAFYILYVKA